MPPLRFTHKSTGKPLLLDTPLTTTLLDLRHQLFSLTDIPPHRLILHINHETLLPNDMLDSARTLSDFSLAPSVPLFYDAIPSPPTSPKTAPPPAASSSATTATVISLSDVQASLRKIRLKPATPVKTAPADRNTAVFLARVKRYWRSILAYEEPLLQQKVRAVMPLSLLRQRATARLGSEPRYCTEERAMLKEVLAWYKKEFMVWMNQPECWSCDKGDMKLVGMMVATEAERRYGGERVEGYRCDACGAASRFARYNHVEKLLETRRGRCGEWAQVFTAMMRAIGMKARMVHDWTDHVWTEVWCEGETGSGGWVHADSCEDVMDEPLLYEAGWGKKLNYCVATGVDCVIDVTSRYTRKWGEVRGRRTLANEGELGKGLERMNEEAVAGVAEGEVHAARERLEWDKKDLQDCLERQEGQAALPGRQSGAKEWVEARGEDGTQK